MHGSKPILMREMRHTVPCSIHRTWRELFCIFFSGAPQYAVVTLWKMTTSDSQLLTVTVLEKHRAMSTASLCVSLGLLVGVTRQPKPRIRFPAAEGYFCPQGEAVAWIS